MLPIVSIIAAANPKNVLWLPLGDSITFGCTGPTIEDCHGYPHGHDTGLVRSLLLSLLSLLLSHSSPLSSLPLPFLCSCITLRSQCYLDNIAVVVIGFLWRLRCRSLHAVAAHTKQTEGGTSLQWEPFPLVPHILQHNGTGTRVTLGGLSTWSTTF